MAIVIEIAGNDLSWGIVNVGIKIKALLNGKGAVSVTQENSESVTRSSRSGTADSDEVEIAIVIEVTGGDDALRIRRVSNKRCGEGSVSIAGSEGYERGRGIPGADH